MVIKAYDPPVLTGVNWTSWDEAFRFAAADAVNYEYDEKWDDRGSFSLVLPFSGARLSVLKMNSVLCVADDCFNMADWLIVEGIAYDGQRISLTGHDSKALLGLRQTVPPESSPVEGYDAVEGTTSQCAIALLHHNCVANLGYSVREQRQLPVTIGSCAAGITNDSYMTAYENLGDCIHNLCYNAGLGYSLKGNALGTGFTFRTLAGTDRSIAQNSGGRVIFSVGHKNVLSLGFEHSVDNLLNVMYTKDSNDVVQTVYRDGETAGLARRECSISVPVSATTEAEAFRMYALNAVEDNVETHSYELTASAASGYGNRYYLGDKVTVKDDFTGSFYNGVITGVEKSFAAGQRGLSLTIGKPKQKLLDKIVKNLKNGVI